MLKPQFGQSVDSAQDVIDRGLIPFSWGHYYKEFLIESPNPLYQHLGRQIVDFTDQATYDKMLREDVLFSNTYVRCTVQ